MDMTFQGAVDRLPDSDANYLGDPDVVEGVIRQFITALIDNWKSAADADVAAAADLAAVERFAKIMAGEDAAYPPVEDWNRTRLAAFAAKFLGIEIGPADTALAVMRDAWASIAAGFYDARTKSIETNSTEPMDFFVAHTIEDWRAVFMGLNTPSAEESSDVE